MFTLIFAIIFGIGFALFALQNTNSVTVTVANIPFSNIPLWTVIIVSLLLGLVFASYFNVINIISSSFKLRDKERSIKGADRKIENLKDEIESVKAENSSLKTLRETS